MSKITTTRGEIDEEFLEKTEGSIDNENEFTTWVEYRMKGEDEIIHRSAHVTLKKALDLANFMIGSPNGGR